LCTKKAKKGIGEIRMTNNPYIGSTLDDLLKEDGTLAEVDAIAIKHVIAWQVAQTMESRNIKGCDLKCR